MKRERCAGGIVLGDNGTIAMIRGQQDESWLFPKGRLDADESDEVAARREIAEETGLDNLELIDDLGTYERYKMNPDGSDNFDRLKEIHMYLFAAAPHALLAPTMEIEEARWVPLPHVANTIGNAADAAWFTTVFPRVRQALQRD